MRFARAVALIFAGIVIVLFFAMLVVGPASVLGE